MKISDFFQIFVPDSLAVIIKLQGSSANTKCRPFQVNINHQVHNR